MKHVHQLLANNIEPGLHNITENLVTIIPPKNQTFYIGVNTSTK